MKNNLFMTGLMIDITARILAKVFEEMDMDYDDVICYLDQLKMDDLGYGINGVVKNG